MAGEIQLNSTTMATESSGSITAQLDTIRPNTTNGSLTLQGDSSDAGVTGLTIDSSGNATFAGTANNLGTVTAGTISGGTIGSSVVFPAGHVLQTVCQTGTTETSDTSGTNVTLYCGWTASITLISASNKIYLNLNLPFQVNRSSGAPYFTDVKLYHQKGTLSTSGSGATLSLTGASSSTIADLYPYRLETSGTKNGVITHQRLITTDNVTNHFTFSAQISTDMDSGYFNRQFGDGSLYSITLMEIAQ